MAFERGQVLGCKGPDVAVVGVDDFDDMSDDAYDGDIRAFAATYLPTLKTQRDAAEKLADQLPK